MVRRTTIRRVSRGILMRGSAFVRISKMYPAFFFATLMISIILLVAILSPYIVPYRPTQQNILDRFQGPSLKHLLGTDQYGRDLFSRVLVGGRTSLAIGIGATILGLLLGVPLGLFTGYWGGKTDEVVMRLMDSLMSFPSLLLALLVLITLGSSSINVILSIAIVYMPRIARVVRSSTLSIKNEEFVLAARAAGESHLYIMFGEILPNALAPIAIEGSIRIGFAILVGASLSFLGMGVQPPTPDWGLMIKQAKSYMFLSPWSIISPGIALGATIMVFNLFGDALRDLLQS